MSEASKEQEAAALRAQAAMIRRHIKAYGAAMGLGDAVGWASVAEAKNVLAEALTLRPLDHYRRSRAVRDALDRRREREAV